MIKEQDKDMEEAFRRFRDSLEVIRTIIECRQGFDEESPLTLITVKLNQR